MRNCISHACLFIVQWYSACVLNMLRHTDHNHDPTLPLMLPSFSSLSLIRPPPYADAPCLSRASNALAAGAMWVWLSDELVACISKLAALQAMPILVQLERRCFLAARGRLQCVKLLRDEPFNMNWTSMTRTVTMLHLDVMDIEDHHIEVLANACESGALTQLRALEIDEGGTRVGAAGMKVIADACAMGALPALLHLHVTGSYVGDNGIKAFADACTRGAFRELKTLFLSDNGIGDIGLQAFAGACVSGALPQLERVILSDNKIGDIGLKAFANAVCIDVVLANLQELYLHNNNIGDQGTQSLVDATVGGALPKCTSIVLLGNPASKEAQQALNDVINNRFK